MLTLYLAGSIFIFVLSNKIRVYLVVVIAIYLKPTYSKRCRSNFMINMKVRKNYIGLPYFIGMYYMVLIGMI